MTTDEYGGIAKSSLPADGATDEYGGVASRPETDEYGGVAKGLLPASETQGQKFQANPGIQAAADQYVKDKWAEYGRSAGASEGQAIRDYAKANFGLSADPSRVPALDFRPEQDAGIQTAYVRNSIANQPGGLDRVQHLEDQWRAEYLRHALPSAIQQQQDAAIAPKPEDVGLIHGHANAILRGAANQVMKPVEGGSELWYALGDQGKGDDGLHGANPNLTPNQLARNATMSVLHEMDDRINNAYKPSTNAANGGFARNTEGFAEMLPSLLLAKGMHGPAAQQLATFGQMGMAAFGDTYQEFYKSGRAEGLDDKTASTNALAGGLAAAAVNTYLMKFGAAGNTGPSSVVRSALTATVHDALAQGAVGTAQGMTSEVAKYIATGESAKIENVIEQAKQGAGAGVLFGLTRGIHEGVANRAAGRGVDHTEAGVSSDPNVPPVPDAKLVDLARINNAPVVDEYGGVAKGTENVSGPGQPVSGDGGGPESDRAGRGPGGAGGVVDEGTPGVGVRPELATPLLDKQTPKLRVNNPDGSSTAKPIDFGSTTDKALYAATEQRQGKIGKEATAYLEAQGYDADRIDREGTMLRDRVAELHDPKQDRITVPKEAEDGLVNKAGTEAPNPAPVPGAADRLDRVAEPQATPAAAEGRVPDGEVRGEGDAGKPVDRPGNDGSADRVAVTDSNGRPLNWDSPEAEAARAKEYESERFNFDKPGVSRSPDFDGTKERQRIGVDESRVEETRYGPAYRDLTHDEIHRLAAVSGENTVRGMHDPATGETVWWGADRAGHHDMARELGWPEPSDRNSLEAQIRGDKVWVHRGGEGKAEAFDGVTKRRNTPEYMRSPEADGYKTELDRVALKGQMERLRGEMQREQEAAAKRVGDKNARFLVEMDEEKRVPTPDKPATNKEVNEALADVQRSDGKLKVYRPQNRTQADLRDLIQRTTGRRVLFVGRADGGRLPYKGVVQNEHPSTIFLNSDISNHLANRVAWHELFHTFQVQHPELAHEILDLFSQSTRDAALSDYMRRARGNPNEPADAYFNALAADPDHQRREMEASLFEAIADNPRIMDSFTKGKRTALQKFVEWVKGLFGKGDLTPFERKMRAYVDRVAEAIRTGERSGDLEPDEGFLSPEETAKLGLSRAPMGAEKFGKEVKDAGKDAVDAMKSAWDGVKRWFAPTLRGPQAEQAAGIMREHLADYAQRMDRLNAAFEQSKAYMDKLPVAATRDFWDKMERGLPQTDPKLQPIADAVRAVYDDRRAAIQGLGTGKLTNFIQNYVNHLYKEKSAGKTLADMGARRPWEGNKGFLKQRKYALFSDAFAQGLTPLTENPVEMMQMYARQADKYIVAQRAFQEMRTVGLAKKVTARQVAEWKKKGYDLINDKIATIYAPPNRRGGLSIAGYYMAPEPVATLINNHLSPGLRSDPFLGKAFRMYQGLGNVMNQVQLGVSGYHATFTTFDSAVAKMALGIEHANRGNWKQAAIEAAKGLSLGEPAVENYLDGKKLQAEWLVPGSHPDYAPFVEALKAGGGRVQQDPFYHTDFREKMKQAWRQGNVIGAAVRGPLAGIEALASPVLEGLVPRLKLGAFMNLARLEFGPDGKGLVGLSRDELRTKAGKIWDSVENRLGEMTYDNLFWNRTAKDLAMASTRAVGWNLGTIRELGGGTLDTAKALGRIATGKRPELTHRMAYTLALPMMTAMLGGITHRLMTGQNPQELKDYFYPGTGELDKSGHMVRLQMPGYMADMLKYGHDLKDAYTEGRPALAARTLGHKTHPMANMIMEMLNNEDYYGDKIRNEDDPFIKRRLDDIKFMGKQLVPFGLRDVGKLQEEGQGAKSLLPLAGIVRARTDVTRSDAENLAAHLMREAHPPASRTSEQRDHEESVRDLADSLRAQEPDAVDKIRKAASDGTLNQGDLERIRQDQRTPDLLGRMVKRLDGAAGLKVWDEATPDERRRIGPILMGKVRSSKTMTRDEKVAAVRKLQSDLKGSAAPEAEEGE